VIEGRITWKSFQTANPPALPDQITNEGDEITNAVEWLAN
jgi:hypothetical protein